jgi:hypothetical protein
MQFQISRIDIQIHKSCENEKLSKAWPYTVNLSSFNHAWVFMHQSTCNQSNFSLSLHATLLFASYYTILGVKSDVVKGSWITLSIN